MTMKSGRFCLCREEINGLVWNFQLQTYLITPVAWPGSRSTFTRQVSTVQNVAHRELSPEFFVKLGGVN